MDETTRTATTPDSPRQFAYCAWHKGHAWDTRLVQLTDQGSGHGGHGLFACTPCRVKHGLTPLADQPTA